MSTTAHRDRRRVEVIRRDAEVLELRIAGLSFDAIAKRMGFAYASGAYQAFQRAMQATVQEPADELRRLELERMDEMLKALWPKVLEGRGFAVEKSLMIMDRRARLLGLDAPTRTQVMVTDQMVAEIESLAAELGVEVDPSKVNH